MTDRIDALRALKAKVEAGDVSAADSWIIHVAFGDEVAGYRTVRLVGAIMNGTLEAEGAARALHEAVLPGWVGVAATSGTSHVCDNDGSEDALAVRLFMETVSGNPARAWLLAVLTALIAIEEQSK